jgi:hypothetical protein
MKATTTLGVIAPTGAGFLLGTWWHKHQLIESGPLQLPQAMSLSGRHGEPGKLPAGTVLYLYSQGPSINTYVTFINTKHTTLLEPVAFEHYLTIAPIEGYMGGEAP